MEGINKKYNLEIEVQTPLSIGAGAESDWVRGVDYVVDNGILYKLNVKKMVQNGISIEDLSSFFTTRNEKGLIAKLAGRLEAVSDSIISIPAESDKDVKGFVKNKLTGNPVLTGSSMKGAFRSVLFQYLRGKENDDKNVFGSPIDGDEFMRFLKFSDAEFCGTTLVNTKVFSLRKCGEKWLGGWKHKVETTDVSFSETDFNTLYECLMPQQKSCVTLMMAEQSFMHFDVRFYEEEIEELQSRMENEQDEKQKKWLSRRIENFNKLKGKVEGKKELMSQRKLFEIVNQHTKCYLEKEKAFFGKYSTDRTDDIIASIDALLRQIPDDNSCCLLKMSAGSGFHSITGDWQFKDSYVEGVFDRKRANRDDLNTPGKILPKTRKIAVWDDHFALMGFVKISAISDGGEEVMYS